MNKIRCIADAHGYFNAGGEYVVPKEQYEILLNYVKRAAIIKQNKATSLQLNSWNMHGLLDPCDILVYLNESTEL